MTEGAGTQPASPAQPAVIGTAARAARTAQVTALILFFAWLIDYVDRLVITLALPDIGKEFGIAKVEQGLIISVFFITYALFQVPGGLIADRIGSRKTMTIALTVWSIFTAFTGAAINYVLLLVIRLIFGASEGIFPGASMKAISERTTPRQRLTANGFMLASNPLGAGLAPLIAAPAIVAVGWRQSFFIICGFGIVIAVIVWFLLPRLPEEGAGQRAQRYNGAAREPDGTTAAAAADIGHRAGRAGQGPPVPSPGLLRAPGLWLLFLVFFGYDTVSWGLVTWAPSYLITTKHLAIGTTGILVAIPWFVGTVTTVAGGFLFDRYFHDSQRWIIVPSMVLSGIFLYFMIVAASVSGFVLFETLAVGVLFFSFMPIVGLPMRTLPQEMAGTATALVNFGGQSAGAVVAVVMGALAGAFGFGAAFGYLIFGVALGVVAVLLCPQRGGDFRRSVLGSAYAASGTEPLRGRADGHRRA